MRPKELKLTLYSALYFYYKNNRKYWVHPFNYRRKRHGEFYTIVKLIQQYPEKYINYFRMPKKHFEYIYSMISNEIKASSLAFRKDTISAKEKLVITLRFLATGCSFTDLALRFLMGRSTIAKCIYQTIRGIIKCLMPVTLPKPTTEHWTRIANDFLVRWNFPNCLGAVDGKHIDCFAPNNSGSLNFNYKKRFSTVLMAIVDADYKFISVDIGAYGSNCDSAIFKNSEFGHLWLNAPEKLSIPNDSCLPNTNIKVPYVLLGDEAFSLKPSLLTPYSGKNLPQVRRLFNYRLSRARRIVENAFGILSSKWRILLKRLEVKQQTTMNEIIMACVILHNVVKTDVNALEKVNIVSHSTEDCSITTNTCTIAASRGYDIRMNKAQPLPRLMELKNMLGY